MPKNNLAVFKHMSAGTTHHIKRKKMTVRVLFFSCFILATTTLLFGKQMEIITSRRALDWLIRMLGCYLTITIIALTRVPRHFFRLSMLLVSIIILGVVFTQSSASPRDILLIAGMSISVGVIYTAHKRRLRTRAEWSSRRYLVFGAPAFLGISAAILSIAFISSFSTTKLDCALIQNNFRRSGIEHKFTQTSLGEMLGLNSAQLQALDQEGDDELSGSEGVLATLISRKNTLIDEALEQQGILQQNVCTLIVQQIDRLQEKPRRQIVGVLLLYILLRPAMSIILRLMFPFFFLLRKFLFEVGYFQTQRVEKKVMEVVIEE